MLMTLTVFGPLELYLTNAEEFWFDIKEMLKISGILTAVVGAVLLTVGIVLPKKGKKWFSAILFIVAFGMYIQGNFLNIDYGVLDGKAIEWSAFRKYSIVNTTCWVAVIALSVFFHKKKPVLFARIAKNASLFVIAVQILTLGILFINNTALFEKTSSRLTADHMMEIGSEENIVIFVLDTFDDPLMDSIMETSGEHYKTLFRDFTRFTDCAAGGATTAAAMPILISGEYYTDRTSYSEYVNGTFNTDGLYDTLEDLGYSINMYTDSPYVGTGASGYVENYVEGQGKPSSYGGLATKYGSFTLFKYMPHILKQYFWLYTAEFDVFKPGESYVMDDASFYSTLMNERLHTTEKNSFRLYHFTGAHYPYTINEYAQPDAEATREQQARGNLYIVEEYLNQMKACGVYDNALIIITADHGNSANYSAPILFVKDRGTTGTYAENDAPVSHLDLHPTLFSYLGKEKGETFFEISQTEPRERLFYLRLQDGGSFHMREYVIRDKVALVGNGTETGNIFKPSAEMTPVALGKKMTLGMEGEANKYIVSGIDTWPLDSVITTGTESEFSFDMGKKISEDIPVEIEVLRLYDDPRKQSVQIYANGQLCHEEAVLGPQTISFTIPAEMLDGSTLELKLVYATKWRPLYLSSITIGSQE